MAQAHDTGGRREASRSGPHADRVALALRAAVARASLYCFTLYTKPAYAMGWVHEELCRELDAFLAAVLAKKSPRLMIAMPPRHGKSELASKRFPAYCFGCRPDLAVIGASYGADLSSRINRDIQRIMEETSYKELFPDTRLAGKNARPADGGACLRTSDLFEIVDRSGCYRSSGVGGGITGMGMDIGIIDDPIKDRAAADSPTVRQAVWDWYTSTFYTRLAPGGGILLIQTRWHTDDLAGRLLEAERAGEGDAWRVVNCPALAEADEPHRRAGEALHPERYSTEQLARIKAALGTRDWEALYQQRPTPDGGAVFRKEWLRYYTSADLPGHFDRLLISWDMAFKDGETADFVVGQVWGKTGARCYLLDQARGRMGFTATLEAFRNLAAKWPGALEKLVEDKANGPAVIDSLRIRVPGIIAVQPEGSKIARAHAVTPLFEAGNVFIPARGGTDWAAEYEAELLQFPASAHDDQVDATTQALRRFHSKSPMRINPSILHK